MGLVDEIQQLMHDAAKDDPMAMEVVVYGSIREDTLDALRADPAMAELMQIRSLMAISTGLLLGLRHMAAVLDANGIRQEPPEGQLVLG